MPSIYLNIGSNKGDRLAHIERAVALLSSRLELERGRIRRAPLEYSQPVGYVSDAEFINLGIAIDFKDGELTLEPLDILAITQSVEKEIAPNSPHRNSDGTYRDRIVDIDIIAIDGVRMESETLTLPHPRAASRRFVMRPMAFLAPEWTFEGNQNSSSLHNKKTIKELERDTLDEFKKKDKLPLVVVLDNIRSLNNVGSIFRTCDAFCVEKIALCGITATPPSPEIHKTALGAEDSVDWAYYASTLSAVRELKEMGYTVVCLEQVHNSISLDRFEPLRNTKYAVVVGNEVNGVDQTVVDNCDVCLEIPQAGTKHSLNVSVSAAIAIWHFFSLLK